MAARSSDMAMPNVVLAAVHRLRETSPEGMDFLSPNL